MILYHATFCINSLAHVWGRKQYVTGDDSRNNWFLAFLCLGEGWHNNHHAYQCSVRQGFRCWEVDPTSYFLKTLSWLGIVWGLKTPPGGVLRNEQRLGSRVIDRAAEQLASHFNAEWIARAIASVLQGHELSALREALAFAHDRSADALNAIRLPQIPTREELLARAKGIFAKTKSLEQIVERANQLLLRAVGDHLTTVEHRA